MTDALNIAPGIEAEDAQALAKAIVTSMLADLDRMRPGERTSALLLSALDDRYESQSAAEVGGVHTVTTFFMVADIAAAAITLLLANGIDVRDHLASPYLLPEDF